MKKAVQIQNFNDELEAHYNRGVFVRASETEAKIRILTEGSDLKHINKISEKICEFLENGANL